VFRLVKVCPYSVDAEERSPRRAYWRCRSESWPGCAGGVWAGVRPQARIVMQVVIGGGGVVAGVEGRRCVVTSPRVGRGWHGCARGTGGGCPPPSTGISSVRDYISCPRRVSWSKTRSVVQLRRDNDGTMSRSVGTLLVTGRYGQLSPSLSGRRWPPGEGAPRSNRGVDMTGRADILYTYIRHVPRRTARQNPRHRAGNLCSNRDWFARRGQMAGKHQQNQVPMQSKLT